MKKIIAGIRQGSCLLAAAVDGNIYANIKPIGTMIIVK